MNEEVSIRGKFTPLYAYGHRAMPQFLDNVSFLQDFIASPIKAANKIWYKTYKALKGYRPPFNLEVFPAYLSDDTTAYVTKYPTPEYYLENLYSAVVIKTTLQKSLFYYFTYELTKDWEPDSDDNAFVLGSWSRGVHLNFGQNKDTSIDGFLAAINKVLESATPINTRYNKL